MWGTYTILTTVFTAETQPVLTSMTGKPGHGTKAF